MDNVDELFLVLASFNTCLGLTNVQKNFLQNQRQDKFEEKLDTILAHLDSLERRLDDGNLLNHKG